MEGPWFGIVIMTLMVVGLVWWILYVTRKDRKRDDQAYYSGN
jgi:cbb3-type cytochrome oxidase subunit 3